jgi:hypothetical protein
MAMRKSTGFLLIFFLLTVGCGLSEYEKRMDQQGQALRRFDEESKALSDPLEYPLLIDAKTTAAKPILPVDFFLRPPKGTDSKAKDLELAAPGKAPLVRYPGPADFNVLVSTYRLAQDAKDAKDPKQIKQGEMTAKEFQHRVREALTRFYEKEFRKPIDWSRAEKTDKKSYQVPQTKGPAVNLIFDYQTLTDDPYPGKNTPQDPKIKPKNEYHDFRLFFYQTPHYQAAIIYQIPADKRKDAAINSGVDYSIRSLALAPESGNRRLEWAKRKKK